MILYFADRKMNIIGQATTNLPDSLIVSNDYKSEDVETGITSFESDIHYDESTCGLVKKCTEVGNYILRSNGSENEFYAIVETEEDTKKRSVNVYAEDAGLDLINSIVGPYEADKAYPLEHYINMFASDSGFEIGINEVSGLTRKLSWEGEATATERLASVATQFDNCEISYSFKVKNLMITNKIINIRKRRGKNEGTTLRLNYELDRIVSKKSASNIATALKCTGGIPENSETPVTLQGYKYDDGDFYVNGDLLCSRKASETWSRYISSKKQDGHIVRTYSFDTLSQQTLCNHAITKLKKLREIAINYEVNISHLPANVGVGDKVTIIDEKGELYLSTRILKLEKSVCNHSYKAVLGEFLIKRNDINSRVLELSSQFTKESLVSKKALSIANKASNSADLAKRQANDALNESNKALTNASNAQNVANQATNSASEANKKADEASSAVENVKNQVGSIEKTVDDANLAAQNAHKAAQTAEANAKTAKEQSQQALTNANQSQLDANQAKLNSQDALNKSQSAVTTASNAQTQAASASSIAQAAKKDAGQAQKDIDIFSKNLTTLESTMKADYARKTDLTAAESKLQTSILQNAAEIATNAKQITVIDETANDAKQIASSATQTATAAQTKANEASIAASTAQTNANKAKADAIAAQTNADNAKLAAQNAETVANQAQTDLVNAKANLETVTNRVGATEKDIADAQTKVLDAQKAADKAKADALTANQVANQAQSTANTASSNASNAQKVADDAATKALNAQTVANQAKGDASAAKQKAEEAAGVASTAQTVANQAKTNASAAQSKAEQAVLDASNAQKAADTAQSKANTAAQDLAQAQKNLEEVKGRVGVTEQEVANAQAAVTTAQKAADKAKADALTAQNTANTAKSNAQKAQTDATNAQKAADTAQAEATLAKQAADKAQADADALKVRVTTAESSITQNANEIKAVVKKTTEIKDDLKSNYLTKEATQSQIKQSADSVKLEVNSQIENIEIGGKNLIQNSLFNETSNAYRFAGRKLKLQPSTEYTLTVNARANRSGESDSHKLSVDVYEINWKMDRYILFTEATDTIKSITFTTLEAEHEYEFRCYWYPNGGDRSGSGTINWAKLEKGNKATDWTPAPEDIDQKISDDINMNVEAVKTTITEAYNSAIQAESNNIKASVDKKITKKVDESNQILSEKINKNQMLMDDRITEFSRTTTNITNALGSTNSDVEQIKEFVRIDGSTMELGSSNNPVRLALTPNKLSFYQKISELENKEIAFFSDEELNVLRAVIGTSIGCGNFQFIDEGKDLGFSLICSKPYK